jgi:hypothetical protein
LISHGGVNIAVIVIGASILEVADVGKLNICSNERISSFIVGILGIQCVTGMRRFNACFVLEPIVHTCADFEIEVLRELLRHLLLGSQVEILQAPTSCFIVKVGQLLKVLQEGLPFIPTSWTIPVDVGLPYQGSIDLCSDFLPLTTIKVHEFSLINYI